MAYRWKRSTTPGEYNWNDDSIGVFVAEGESSQLATDQAAVLAEAANIKDDTTILDQAGTYDFAAASAAAASSQHDTDAAFLETNKDEILAVGTDILGEFSVTGTATPILIIENG